MKAGADVDRNATALEHSGVRIVGKLIEGVWSDVWYDTKTTGGRFRRKESQFRHWVRADGSTAFQPEAGRYLLYVSLACPWAHRVLLYRSLLGLEACIDVAVVDYLMLEQGWAFREGAGNTPDPIMGAEYLHQLYTRAMPDYTGRVTVPVLWDRGQDTIVNNESSELIRMLHDEFRALARTPRSLYPLEQREEIDRLNQRIYVDLNNGVYKAGFSTEQAVYEEAVEALFGTLDWLEQRLDTRRYLLGQRLSEADWRLFPTLLRFDPVYVGHFKCNLRPLAAYKNLSGYLRELYQLPGVAETVNFEHIKGHYYGSHPTLNPSGVVPKGPLLDWGAPHGRDRLPTLEAGGS